MAAADMATHALIDAGDSEDELYGGESNTGSYEQFIIAPTRVESDLGDRRESLQRKRRTLLLCIVLFPLGMLAGFAINIQIIDYLGPFPTKTELALAVNVVSRMDPSANPCTNFYQYACGAYEHHHYMDSVIGTVQTNMLQLLEATAAATVPESQEFLQQCYNYIDTEASHHPKIRTVNMLSVIEAFDHGLAVYDWYIDYVNRDNELTAVLLHKDRIFDYRTTKLFSLPCRAEAIQISHALPSNVKLLSPDPDDVCQMLTAVPSLDAPSPINITTPSSFTECIWLLGRLWPATIGTYFPHDPIAAEYLESIRRRVIDALHLDGELKYKVEQIKFHTVWSAIGWSDVKRNGTAIAFDPVQSTISAAALDAKMRRAFTLDESVWAMTPWTMNAYYIPELNAIYIPQAMSFFMDAYAPDAIMGAVIAHEIGHSIDANGLWYGPTGERLAVPLASYPSFVSCMRGWYPYGNLTLNENIADYVSITSGPFTKLKVKMKDMPTPEQLSYIADAQFYCSGVPKFGNRKNHTDVHSDNSIRVQRTVQLSEKWRAAFGCNDNLPEPCSIF